MDPRYTGRPPSPRRYGQAARTSTGRLDSYSSEYDNYYPPPRLSRESIVPGPRGSGERIPPPRNEPRLIRDPIARTSRDDYTVAPRRDPLPPQTRRPLSVITPAESPNRYRPVITSAADYVPSPYKPRPREEDPYYILPAASSNNHHRHFSAGGEDNGRYIDPNRDRRVEKGGYRSAGPPRPPVDYSRMPQIREPRDSQDRDFGYEYTNRKEQVYRDTEPRRRTRRGSDVGPREKYYAGPEPSQRQAREAGPPVTLRGFSKIDPSGTTRTEYRVPKESDAPSRDQSLVRSSRDDKELERLRPSRASIAVHQENDGYSSNLEDRPRERRHRHRRHDSVDHEKDRDLGTRHYDERRFEERAKTHNTADAEDRHHKSRRHRDTSEDRHGSHHMRRHEREEDEDRKHRDEPRRERHEKRDKHDRNEKTDRTEVVEKQDRSDKPDKPEKHDHRKLAEGIGLGAAGAAAATGLIAETIKHRREKESSEADNDNAWDKTRRSDRRRADADQENGSRSDETDEGYRERRRRRRREREERERKSREDEEPGLPRETTKSLDQDTIVHADEIQVETEGEDERLGRRRQRKERRESSGESSDEVARRNKERSRVRVVSPAKEPTKKPKGILRPPTQKFPEDPASIREGVAPLKDAGKKGIPPNARWTKIDRRLVNPEALELGNERYEERPDYVIILRVLSKEEIEKYAEVTEELRKRRAQGSKEGETLTIKDASHNYASHGHSSDEEAPRQIDAVPYNQPESLPVRDRSIEADLQGINSKSSAIAETVVNAHQRSSHQLMTEEPQQYESDRDRPSLPTGGSYHRVAPPNIQPPSSIPMYPPMPPASAPIDRGPYMAPPGAPGGLQDPAASWHGATPTAPGLGSYPAVPVSQGQPLSQGHTPPPPPPPTTQAPPPIPPKEVNI